MLQHVGNKKLSKGQAVLAELKAKKPLRNKDHKDNRQEIKKDRKNSK